MKPLSYQQKSYASVIMAVAVLLVLATLFAKLNLVQQYQYAYTELSHQVQFIRDQVYKVKVSDNHSYDKITQSLVNVERQVQQLQQRLQPLHASKIGSSIIIDENMREHAKQYSSTVKELIANLETLLRLKISQEYSVHTVSLLQQDLLNSYTDADSKMHIFALAAGNPQINTSENPLFNTSQYQSLAVHIELLAKLDEQIKLKSQQVFNANVSDSIAEQARFWLVLVDDIKFYLLLMSICLLGIYAINYRIQLREQARKESKILHDLSKIEQEKAQLSLVAEHAQDAIIITDSSGCITWVNKGFVTLSGYKPEEIRGKKPGKILQGKNTSKQEVDRIRQGINRQESIKSELINYHKDGSEYWIDIAINPIINPKGQVTHFIAVERDSTARKRMESQLAQAVIKADVSNKAKSTFLATMSHELRTPLNGILGMAQIIEPNLENPEHRQQIQILLESGNHLTSLLNDILDFSKVEEGKLCLENELFQLKTVIEPIISTYEPICAEKDISFEVKNSINEAQSFKGDKARVRQIIYNLLSNSVKFTESGRVTLSFKQAVNEAGTSGVAMCIQDSGIGIRQERLDSIFDPFIQAESSTTRQYGGTGLGLSIVKQLVELMGGVITVSSKVGLGTRFDIFIALERAQMPVNTSSETSKVKQALPENIRILIAEDNKVNALVAKTFCQRLGHNVEIAYNGLEAINILKTKPFDLVIMDNHMPEMDGIEATEYIRKTLNLSVPVFACTADVFKEAHDNMINAGANHVLTKPLQEQSFRDALAQFAHLIGKEQQLKANDNKVVALSRHQPQELNTTEADIDYRQLRAALADAETFSQHIAEFNEFAEGSITELIAAYDDDNAADICQLASMIRDKAEVFFSARIYTLALEITDTLAGAESVFESQLKLERLQQLINLLEVNIHQNQRLKQGQSIEHKNDDVSNVS
ncbi:ATP-binding protein [Shewanella sp. 1CM18E]|uniref:PAS domain-containing hybrid sensor histidine kinase/response regulator n=1 Tax=Shewanella sp. 1CM18E TaxID=2929169 RepID=UPI0020BE4A80|nr:ATP-binding protein [Shewanella sp. 1CM18E]MCK8044978.1 ATP-binding protein [Shewanella sp. 1CM18E]